LYVFVFQFLLFFDLLGYLCSALAALYFHPYVPIVFCEPLVLSSFSGSK